MRPKQVPCCGRGLQAACNGRLTAEAAAKEPIPSPEPQTKPCRRPAWSAQQLHSELAQAIPSWHVGCKARERNACAQLLEPTKPLLA